MRCSSAPGLLTVAVYWSMAATGSASFDRREVTTAAAGASPALKSPSSNVSVT